MIQMSVFANIENRLQMLVMNAKQRNLEENEERDRRRKSSLHGK